MGLSWLRKASDVEEFLLGADAANLVEKLASGFDADADVVEVFLHFLDVGALVAGQAHCLEESTNIGQNIVTTREEERLATLLLADLVKEPGIANGAATDHKSARAGEAKDFVGFGCGVDVAVGENRAGDRFDGAGDEIVMDSRAIHFVNGAAMDGEEIERVFRENRQQFVEYLGRMETDACFHGERDVQRIA